MPPDDVMELPPETINRPADALPLKVEIVPPRAPWIPEDAVAVKALSHGGLGQDWVYVRPKEFREDKVIKNVWFHENEKLRKIDWAIEVSVVTGLGRFRHIIVEPEEMKKIDMIKRLRNELSPNT